MSSEVFHRISKICIDFHALLAGWLLGYLANWLHHSAAGLARLARLAGNGVWFLAFVGKRLGSTALRQARRSGEVGGLNNR